MNASTKWWLRTLAWTSAAAMVAPVASVRAAEQPATAKSPGEVEEIVVSATYRDTRLMDTPLTISAVSAMDISNKGIEDIQTLYQSVPGLAYRTNSQTYNTLSVRGLTPPAAGGAATVGVYMDNLPMTDSTSGGLSQSLGVLFDMERVEALKGPQGTLYGEGSMGGALRYITKMPNPEGFDYSVQASIEDMSESSGLSNRIDAMVNIPLGEKMAMRIVGYRRDKKGLLDQVAPANKKDADFNEEIGGRVKLTWYATDTLEITGTVNIINGDYGGPGLAFHCFTESTPSDPTGQVPVYPLPGTDCDRGQLDQFKIDPYITNQGHPTHTNGGFDDQTMYNLDIEWELPFANLTSSTSYFDRSTAYSEETSPRFSIGLVNLAWSVFGPDTLAVDGGDGAFYRAAERFVQEVRMVSNTDSRFQWTAGLYYKDDDSQGGRHARCHKGGSPVYDTVPQEHCWLQYSFFEGVPIATQAQIVQFMNGIVPGNTSYNTYQEEALFGEVSYRFSEQWEVLLGLRFAEVTHDLDLARSGIDSRSNPVNSQSITTDIVSPKATVTWRPAPDWMLYATISQGFRPGIVNTGLAGKITQLDAARANSAVAQAHYTRLVNLQTVDGDEVYNYEIGAKATVADGRVSFTGALYNIDWRDTIIAVGEEILGLEALGVTPFRFTYNINQGKAESQGLELEFRTVLTDSLRLDFGGDWNWTADILTAGEARYLGVAIQPGNRLANAPKYSGYVGLAYDFNLGGYDATARADWYAVGESWNTANNERPAPAYETLDLKLMVNRDKWQAAFYIRNVTDEVVVYEFNQVGYRYGRPRTFGLQFNYNI